MEIVSLKFKGYKCFTDDWAGFDDFKPVNIIIGRNNSGKSHLLDLIHASTEISKIYVSNWKYFGITFRLGGLLPMEAMANFFPQGSYDGQLQGQHWASHGSHLVNTKVEWTSTNNIDVLRESIEFSKEALSCINKPNIPYYRDILSSYLEKKVNSPFSKKYYKLLSAERDIRREMKNNKLFLEPNGGGATNIIRQYLNSSNYPRELIKHQLLESLNEIFGTDGHFEEIIVREHDGEDALSSTWEIYLLERNKGLIELSESGSGLKTIILVLLNFVVVPELEQKHISWFVYAFEELENNLHPALFRRLLKYIENFVIENNTNVFLTTHSNVALDVFGMSENAQIIHVSHDGTSAKTRTITAHFEKLGVISELGAKPSDLLQANGIIWVEGPSDRIYINHWIQLASDGKYREGRDYQCAFYGGALLSKIEFTDPEEKKDDELVDLLNVNPNIIVICDGDRSGKTSGYKPRVKRIEKEVNEIPGAVFWKTKGREIENYLPGEVLEKVYSKKELPDPEEFESFFPKKRSSTQSYIEKNLTRVTMDKTELALNCKEHMTMQNMTSRFDWPEKMKEIVECIERWNR